MNEMETALSAQMVEMFSERKACAPCAEGLVSPKHREGASHRDWYDKVLRLT